MLSSAEFITVSMNADAGRMDIAAAIRRLLTVSIASQQFRHLATMRVMSSRCSCGLKRRTLS